jgi:hypothetical protein
LQVATVAGNTAAIDAKLKDLIAATTTGLADVKAQLQAGFGNLSQGLHVLIEGQKQGNALLKTQVSQNDVIICWLKIIAEIECRQLHRLEELVALSTELRDDVDHLRSVGDLVHSREAVELANDAAIKARLDACCPPKKPEPHPCFEPCCEPEVVIYEPEPIPWQPLPYGNSDGH